MKTILTFIVGTKKKEINLFKEYEGFLPLHEGVMVSTGMYLLMARSCFFDVVTNTFTVKLDYAEEKNENFDMRVGILKSYGWHE